MKGRRTKRDRCGMIYEVVSNRDLGRVILNCRGLSIASPRYVRGLTDVSLIYLDEMSSFHLINSKAPVTYQRDTLLNQISGLLWYQRLLLPKIYSSA